MKSIYFPIAASLLATAHAQSSKPDPIFDCTNPNYRVIYTACSAGDYEHCCAVGTSCCAGGCCDLESFCVGIGTPQETCCEAGDATNCGTGPLPAQSVACTGSDGLSSYYCPPDATCDSDHDTCIGGENSEPSSSRPHWTSPPSSIPPFSTPYVPSSTPPTTMVITVTPSSSPSSPEESTTIVSSQEPGTITVTEGGSSTSSEVQSGSVVTVTASQPVQTTGAGDDTAVAVNGLVLVLTMVLMLLI
ncbi:hypothetical protein F5Y16DRAFT_284912 [Xylariaceae sp. FL0255]|nr:hypothetical protein F5Y16DRAFT_284912 [Xylariaceae sp. FL0255]